VTFLFTDVEGSTRRWEVDAAGMRVALATHNEVLRRAIEGHGGWLFKHTGDGVCAAFASPRSAVDAAMAAQRALELPVRMGLATGEAELRDGDYFGAVLNRAARVMAAGHGGQILLADSTAGLLGGVDLLDLGPRRLRDLAAPIEVFQVRAPGLQADFPALRALDASPGNLRPATTSFIGRESEVAELRAAVKAHRLVTLTGVVGSARPAWRWKSRRGWPMSFPTGFGFSSWPQSPIRRRYPTQWRRCWASPNNPAAAWPRAWPRPWRAGCGCWYLTTANTFSTPPPT
jgi:Adenylate and Guanylate cyclase catalytic domain